MPVNQMWFNRVHLLWTITKKNGTFILMALLLGWVLLTGMIIFNSFWPSDTIWGQRSGSTLAQVMACCMRAPSHYLNQCWLIISEVQWHSYEGNFTRDALTIISLKTTYLKFHSNCPGANELNHIGLLLYSLANHKLVTHIPFTPESQQQVIYCIYRLNA